MNHVARKDVESINKVEKQFMISHADVLIGKPDKFLSSWPHCAETKYRWRKINIWRQIQYVYYINRCTARVPKVEDIFKKSISFRSKFNTNAKNVKLKNICWLCYCLFIFELPFGLQLLTGEIIDRFNPDTFSSCPKQWS